MSHKMDLSSKGVVGHAQNAQFDGVPEQKNPAEPASTILTIEPVLARPNGEIQSLCVPLPRPCQVPTRRSTLHSGFQITTALESAGVTKEQWIIFTKEIRQMARLSSKQWVTVNTAALAAFIVFLPTSLLAYPVGLIVGYKIYKHQNLKNFDDAQSSGLVQQCTNRWNLEYFESRGLHVDVSTPKSRSCVWAGFANTGDMDIASTRLFRPYQKNRAISSKRRNSEIFKAARKVRIVVWPLDLVPHEARMLRPSLQASGTPEDPDLSVNQQLSSSVPDHAPTCPVNSVSYDGTSV